jgi:hypothetical protein
VIFQNNSSLNREPTMISFIKFLIHKTLDTTMISLLLPIYERNVEKIVPEIMVLLDV